MRLRSFVAAVVLALAAGFGAGRLTGGGAVASGTVGTAPAVQVPGTRTSPGAVRASEVPAGQPAAGGQAAAPVHVHAAAVPAGTGTSAVVGGLAVSAAGLSLRAVSTTVPAGRLQPFRFRVVGPDGKAVTAFAVVHDRPLHLVVIRRDLTGYQHLHPVMAPDGTWSTPLRLPTAGSWRAYADFTAVVGGQQTATTLGVDLDVAGSYAPAALPVPAPAERVAGFTVSYEGSARVGATQPLLVRVARGSTAAPLQPYLGAYGHLVVVRAGDLGYVHVHPEPQLVDGAVKFWLAAPGPGRYRMFFDFQVAGQVHTAAFTTTVS